MIGPLARRLALSCATSLAALWLTACRGGLDASCRCNTDCRAGLVCKAEGEKALMADMCFNLGVNGVCAEGEVLDSDSGMAADLTEPTVYEDLPSRRDFQPGSSDSVSAGMTEATSEPTTTGTTGTTGTTTATTGDTSTGTGDTTGTTTATTGTTTTGDTTGATDTTGESTSTGTSTGSSGTSDTSGSSGSSGSTGTSTGTSGESSSTGGSSSTGP